MAIVTKDTENNRITIIDNNRVQDLSAENEDRIRVKSSISRPLLFFINQYP